MAKEMRGGGQGPQKRDNRQRLQEGRRQGEDGKPAESSPASLKQGRRVGRSLVVKALAWHAQSPGLYPSTP